MKSSEESARNAQAQIIIRLLILKSWRDTQIPWKIGSDGKTIRDEDGEEILEYYPVTKFEFCSWTSSKNSTHHAETLFIADVGLSDSFPEIKIACLSQLNRISRSTLDKYSVLCATALTAMVLLKDAAKAQTASHNRKSQIATLTSKKTYLERVAAAQERELRIERSKTVRLVGNLAEEADRYYRNETQYQKEIAERDERIAILTKSLSKVSPLKPS